MLDTQHSETIPVADPATAEPPFGIAVPSRSLSDTVTDDSVPALKRYRDVIVGEPGLWPLIKLELVVLLFGSIPGALGMVLRRIFFPLIFGSVGRGVIFGRNLTIRHGHKIKLSDHVVVDDYAVLDAKGERNDGIEIGSDTMISRNCIMSCKGGNIRIGNGVALGPNSLIHAIEGSDVSVGDHAAIAAFTYLIGGGNYHSERLDVPMKKQGTFARGGVEIGSGAWVGSHVQVLDGVRVGADSIIAAGSVVNHDVPVYAVVGGVPAKPIKSRVMSESH